MENERNIAYSLKKSRMPVEMARFYEELFLKVIPLVISGMTPQQIKVELREYGIGRVSGQIKRVQRRLREENISINPSETQGPIS